MRRAAFVFVALLMAACGSRSSTPTSAQSPTHEQLSYELTLAHDLAKMEVRLCYEGVAGPLIFGRSEAAMRLESARWLEPLPRKRMPIRNGRVELPAGVAEGCLEYVVSLAEGGSLQALVTRTGPHLLASPNAWLLRPHRRTREIRGTLRVHAPEGVRASLPWPEQGGAYQLDASTFAFDGHAAFGPFRTLSLESEGVPTRVAVVGEMPGLTDAAIERWLASAARVGSLSDGTFPAPQLHLIVVASPGQREPFGSVARGGGASVLMFVPPQLAGAELSRDWVLPHELSHLLLPFIAREEAWLPEGLATYYQEVLRARAGILSSEQALSNLARNMGSARDEGTGRTLCDESRAMHQTFAYRPVYWGGAAQWLITDVALREQGQSLDALLSQLRNEARLAPPYTAAELTKRLDQLSNTNLFSAMLERCSDQPFPSFESALRKLGWSDQQQPAAENPLRRAIFSAQPAK